MCSGVPLSVVYYILWPHHPFAQTGVCAPIGSTSFCHIFTNLTVDADLHFCAVTRRLIQLVNIPKPAAAARRPFGTKFVRVTACLCPEPEILHEVIHKGPVGNFPNNVQMQPRNFFFAAFTKMQQFVILTAATQSETRLKIAYIGVNFTVHTRCSNCRQLTDTGATAQPDHRTNSKPNACKSYPQDDD